MGVPKKRTTPSKRNMRRSHDALERSCAITCPNCGETVLRHRACSSCGYYRGKAVVEIKTKEEEAAEA